MWGWWERLSQLSGQRKQHVRCPRCPKLLMSVGLEEEARMGEGGGRWTGVEGRVGAEFRLYPDRSGKQ